MEAATHRDDSVRTAEAKVYAERGLHPHTTTVTVDTGYGSTEVRLTEIGRDNPGVPVVLLHGVASVTILAAPLLSGLEGRRVIAVDWPGHGLSGPCVLPKGAQLRLHAVRVLESLLDELGMGTVDLVGHSLGAQFSLYTALDAPERVRRVVLLGAPGAAFVGVKPVAAMKALALPGVGRALLSLPMSEAMFTRNNDEMLGVGALSHLGPDLSTAAYLLAGRTANAASIASYFRALLKRGSVRPENVTTYDDLAGLRVPALLVWGDADTFMAPLDASRSIVSIRDVRLQRFPTAGHAPWLQEEQATAEAIARHLD